MCAEYEVRLSNREIEEALGTPIVSSDGKDEWISRVRLTDAAPVLQMQGGRLHIRASVFPAHPFPNARLTSREPSGASRVYEKPTWRPGFNRKPMIAVMSSFMEPAYWGPSAGSVLRFLPPEGHRLFFVAAIGIHGNKPKTEDAFAVLTHTATNQMLEYHHRLIVLLKPSDAVRWLTSDWSEKERFAFITERRWAPEFEILEERRMARGWEKRAPQHLRALEEEINSALDS